MNNTDHDIIFIYHYCEFVNNQIIAIIYYRYAEDDGSLVITFIKKHCACLNHKKVYCFYNIKIETSAYTDPKHRHNIEISCMDYNYYGLL